MKIKNFSKINIFIVSALFFSTECSAITGNTTPTLYNVNLQKVEFHKVGEASNSFFTYRSGTSDIDIASVLPNEPCASLGPTSVPTNAQYDQFRVTVSNSITVEGESDGNLSNGLPCRTVANGAAILDPFGDGSVSVAYLGSTDGGTPEPQTVTVPTGSGVTLPSGFVNLGSAIQATFPVSFTVNNSVPQGNVKFNVSNGILFQAISVSQCVVVPMPPSIDVSIA